MSAVSSHPLDGETQPPPATGGMNRIQVARTLVVVAAFISFLFSVTLWFTGSEDEGLFVGIWVPSILSLGGFLIPREATR